MDNRLKKLSNTIVNYSLDIKAGERVLIKYQNDKCSDLVKILIKDIYNKKGIPFVRMENPEISALLLELTNHSRIEEIRKQAQFDIDNYDCFINIRYLINDYENKNILPEIKKEIGFATKEIDDIRINERKWVLLNYPSMIDANKAKKKIDEFYDYSLDVMTVDYKEMYQNIQPLKRIMEKTDKVRIIGPNTDLTFSIKNMPVNPCCGTHNIPDGEIYTAPIRESVNGTINYNTPCPYQGNVFTNVLLTFKDGKIIDCSCNEDQEQLNNIFDTDEGSRYI